MKKILITLMMFCYLTSFGQENTGKTELGEVAFGGFAQFSLKASVDQGKFHYKLIDNLNPSTPKFAFSLSVNTLSDFKQNIEINIKGIKTKDGRDLTVTEAELDKYYYSFLAQNYLSLENAEGGKAMEMKFNDNLIINGFEHDNFIVTRQKDVSELITTLFDVEIDESKIFESALYADDKFDSKFKAELQKIKDSRATNPIKNENLYKLVSNQYNNSILKKLKDTHGQDLIALEGNKENKNKKIDLLKSEIDKHIKDSLLNYNLKMNSINELNTNNSLLSNEYKKIILEIDTINRINFINNEDLLIKIITSNNDINSFKERLIAINEKLDLNRILINKVALILKEFNGEIDETTILEKIYSIQQINNKNLETSLNIEKLINNKIRLDSDIEAYNSKNLEKSRSIEILNLEKENLKNEILDLEIGIQAKTNTTIQELKKSGKLRYLPTKIQLEINKGYIENITVFGSSFIYMPDEIIELIGNLSLPNKDLKFVNDYPIGISAKMDIQRLKNIKLYSRYENEMHYELRLGDLISNIEEILELNRKDYSPKDDMYEIDLLSEKRKTFYKNPSKDILEVKIFTDFLGINENKPNGLIQIELNKEVPLITKRLQKSQIFGIARWTINKNGNVGFFNFIRPEFVLSKIESNQRSLLLTGIPLESKDTLYVASGLNLKQFERFSTGFDLNFLLYDIPYAKSTFLLNGGIRFGRTDLASNDTLPEQNNFPRNFTNTYQPDLEVTWRINGDERFGLEMSYAWNWILSDEMFFKQRSSTIDMETFDDFSKSGSMKRIQRITFLAYINTNNETNGRLFFRYRANSELREWRNNFSQVQLGYTTYLTKKNQ